MKVSVDSWGVLFIVCGVAVIVLRKRHATVSRNWEERLGGFVHDAKYHEYSLLVIGILLIAAGLLRVFDVI